MLSLSIHGVPYCVARYLELVVMACLFQGLRRRYRCLEELWTTLCSGFLTRAAQVCDYLLLLLLLSDFSVNCTPAYLSQTLINPFILGPPNPQHLLITTMLASRYYRNHSSRVHQRPTLTHEEKNWQRLEVTDKCHL